jgi:hypothetical protein
MRDASHLKRITRPGSRAEALLQGRASSATASPIASYAKAAETLQLFAPLLGHSRTDTTQIYTNEIELDKLAAALARALLARDAQASPDLATLETELSDELESLKWRRRESNPRPRSHRTERLQA